MYWRQSAWIIAGIILFVCGILIDGIIAVGVIQGTVDISSNYDQYWTEFGYFIGPLLPGWFAVYYGLRKQSAPSLTESANSTGILFGNGLFYKNPTTAAVLSMIIPGMGQAYNGQSALGMLFAFGAGIGLLFALVPGILIWLFSIYIAYSSARSINREIIPFAPIDPVTIIVIIGLFIPCLMVTYVFVGAFGPGVVLGMTNEKICSLVHCG